MRFRHIFFALSFLAPLTAGCSTITKGTTQPISVNTPGAEGALCDLSAPKFGTKTVQTPANIIVQKGFKDIQVVCRKACYQEATGIIEAVPAAMTAGNILVGGGIGLAVDAASGAMMKYQPGITLHMKRIPGCRRR